MLFPYGVYTALCFHAPFPLQPLWHLVHTAFVSHKAKRKLLPLASKVGPIIRQSETVASGSRFSWVLEKRAAVGVTPCCAIPKLGVAWQPMNDSIQYGGGYFSDQLH